MIKHVLLTNEEVREGIHRGSICYGGHLKLKIYGHLHCTSGKRMKKVNRIFFKSIHEAQSAGYRPCGHCMNAAYQLFKNGIV
jgi:methylphosphotriester-DNA--protein-cysteine methyltransferase